MVYVYSTITVRSEYAPTMVEVGMVQKLFHVTSTRSGFSPLILSKNLCSATGESNSVCILFLYCGLKPTSHLIINLIYLQ